MSNVECIGGLLCDCPACEQAWDRIEQQATENEATSEATPWCERADAWSRD